MVSSGLLRPVALERTDVSEEPGASFIRVTKIGELGTTQAATSNRCKLRNFAAYVGSSETSVLTRATRRNNPEDTILHSHRRENLKSYSDTVVQFLYCSGSFHGRNKRIVILNPTLSLSLSFSVICYLHSIIFSLHDPTPRKATNTCT
jgi:hypothetical protein